MNELIERLAREAGYDAFKDGTIYMPTHEGAGPSDEAAFLARFAALVAEQCAKEAESVEWWAEDSKIDGRLASDDEGHLIAAQRIRSKFPMPKP